MEQWWNDNDRGKQGMEQWWNDTDRGKLGMEQWRNDTDKENLSTCRKVYSSVTSYTTNLMQTDRGMSPGLHSERMVTVCLSHNTACRLQSHDWQVGLVMSFLNILRVGADKSLARPTSRCRRTESVVSLERGVCSCAELQVISCYRG